MTNEAIREEFIRTAYTVMPITEREAGQYADWWLSKLQAQALEIISLAEGAKFRNNPKGYDGNNLEDASNYHGIAAETWAEIIRHEDGHDAALSDLTSQIRERYLADNR
jgi:hypothetical protein